jgi:hypothetical protein
VSSTRTAIGISGGGGSAVSIVSGLGGALRFRGRHPPNRIAYIIGAGERGRLVSGAPPRTR